MYWLLYSYICGFQLKGHGPLGKAGAPALPLVVRELGQELGTTLEGGGPVRDNREKL